MSPLQCPQQCPPADAGIHLPGSVLCDVGTYGGRNGGKFEIKSHSITFLYQTISHTFCPECFVRRPACIFTVLSAWKLRNVHGVQKASLYVKSGFRPAREQR
ncbi:unnamed protein product [Staurois parvus]|uniref:Uncharacterized protein n=1 Tax=Staurois parvus TaxID=386267 RepID=A0ABN9GWQ8_9NEOB|nr:unnamed protein product [Staurois parvus]